MCAGALSRVKTDTYKAMQLKLHKPKMAISYSLRMCAQNIDSTNPGQSNLVFRSKPIPEAEMSNRLIERLQHSSTALNETNPKCVARMLTGTNCSVSIV